jgi:Zn-dependent protease with chaperone function
MSLLLAVAVDALDRYVNAIPSARLLAEPIARLVDADRQAAGARLIAFELPGWFAAVFAQALALLYFWRAGGAARWRDALRAALGGEAAVRFAFGATLAVVARTAAVLPSFYLWRVERVMGLSHVLTRVWAYEYVLGTLIGMLVAGCIAVVVLWLVERTHQWYLYTIGGIIVISLVGTLVDPYAIAPLFERYVPLGGAIGLRARAFAAREGYAGVPIVVEHRVDRIPVDAAKTEGMGPTQRIVLADAVVDTSTPQEIEFYIATEIAQLDNHDPLNLALVDAAIVIIGTAIAVFIADRVPFRRDDDPISRITLVGALLAIVYIVAVPIDHAAVVSMRLRAEHAAVAMTANRAAALRALVRAGDEQIEQVCPSAVGRTFLYRAPTLGEDALAAGSKTTGCR